MQGPVENLFALHPTEVADVFQEVLVNAQISVEHGEFAANEQVEGWGEVPAVEVGLQVDRPPAAKEVGRVVDLPPSSCVESVGHLGEHKI